MPRHAKPLKFDNHRKPPRPDSWNVERGNCRFCGGPIVEHGKVNRRKHWHQSCADLWRIMNNPTVAKHHVFLRERGTCQGCGMISPLPADFDVDHIEPLFEAFGDPRYYEPENMQLLCKSCHRDKTKEDMQRYHEINRIRLPDPS